MEGESAFQLRDGLFVRPAAGHEVPEVRERVVEVARDGRVLVVAVVRIEEIQLEVLGRAVFDSSPIDRHPSGVPEGLATADTTNPDTSAVTRLHLGELRMNCCRSSQWWKGTLMA